MMKYLVIICAVLHLSCARTMPEYLRKYVCRQSDPEYEKCIRDGFERTRPYFAKGIPELNVPALDPFELPFMIVNRTISETVSISAYCKNIKVLGNSKYVIDDLKCDPFTNYGELRVTLPWTYLEMEYNVTGQLLTIPLNSDGFFEGNFTDTQIFVKGSLKKYKKKGVEYFKVNKIDSKIVVGDGHIKLTSKDPELQLGADVIADFYNDNPRQTMDAVNPIFVETATELFRIVSDQILPRLPASEWLPA